ncbi:hypothetical protein H2203_000981 [Taxawa tesnikishii (nom. ined.)]|nr:hypothetical protein H2203_000981 [Dothideales sp. JES 119]
MSFPLPLSPTVLAVGGFVCLACFLYRLALPKPIPGVPYNKASALRVLGDVPDLLAHVKATDGEVQSWFAAQCVEHDSPIIQLFVRPFRKPTVIVTDFREMQDILMRRSREFGRSTFLGDLFKGVGPNHHIWMPTQERFRQQRRLLADTQGPAFLNETGGPRIYESMQDLLELWRLKEKLAQGHPFEAPQDLQYAAFDALWVSTFGSVVGIMTSQIQPLRETTQIPLSANKDTPAVFPYVAPPEAFTSLSRVMSTVETMQSSPLPRLHHWFIRQTRWYKTAKAYKDQLIDESLKLAVKRVSRGETELFGFLIGGHETSSTTITWGLKFLSDHPQVQHKLRSVLRASFSSAASAKTNPSCKEILTTSIPYLDACIEEVLRCGLTVPGAVRVTKVDTDILGHRIPKGVDVMCLVNGPDFVQQSLPVEEVKRSASSQANKDKVGLWDTTDIGLFQPERWLREEEKGDVVFDPRAGQNMPFGLGVRGCFGRKLAMVELRIIFVLILWNFELQPTPKELSGYRACDRVTHQPQQCYIRIKSADG